MRAVCRVDLRTSVSPPLPHSLASILHPLPASLPPARAVCGRLTPSCWNRTHRAAGRQRRRRQRRPGSNQRRWRRRGCGRCCGQRRHSTTTPGAVAAGLSLQAMCSGVRTVACRPAAQLGGGPAGMPPRLIGQAPFPCRGAQHGPGSVPAPCRRWQPRRST